MYSPSLSCLPFKETKLYPEQLYLSVQKFNPNIKPGPRENIRVTNILVFQHLQKLELTQIFRLISVIQATFGSRPSS